MFVFGFLVFYLLILFCLCLFLEDVNKTIKEFDKVANEVDDQIKKDRELLSNLRNTKYKSGKRVQC